MNLLGVREFHLFEAAGKPFAYMVPSAAVFQLDEVSHAIIGALNDRYLTEQQITGALVDRFPAREVAAGSPAAPRMRTTSG